MDTVDPTVGLADDVALEKATPRDAETLADISERAFHSDVECGAPAPGGPPGYDLPEWQTKMMRLGEYYKITCGDRIVGGCIVFRQDTRAYEVGRIFVDPDAQSRGVGAAAFEGLWRLYPLVKRWTLGTPKWNRRTRHFYPKVGFTEIGEDAHGGVLFERVTPAR
ncbi:GNAT family N-acetyltransferase [Candidatus Poribacteria bacterium]|jgi:GNAT superfamily N-acetyltransferase|nr:GNAT family N-acetyltransferase [Candidatus Poribacteria bacterium]MBT5535849.1 GNAT family N-acetyltransferase [Candidatus Poribacteria bacterium]MBT5715027.1 GNAT family N-acetyltransferase [Candidatus Poribacteria bacterium]MBT7098838.1 GNAT family N-acetyltransferase [Candidatus Poribacteria bacterium]MBT7806476.1 GNAT family N-acetyltransferase [Candidatus Poribacteria bacterium]